MDSLKYGILQEEQFVKFESICKRCGACCGSQDGDPCLNLAKNPATGKYHCKDYKNRLGLQETESGNLFHCIPIRDILKHSTLRPICAYNSLT